MIAARPSPRDQLFSSRDLSNKHVCLVTRSSVPLLSNYRASAAVLISVLLIVVETKYCEFFSFDISCHIIFKMLPSALIHRAAGYPNLAGYLPASYYPFLYSQVRACCFVCWAVVYNKSGTVFACRFCRCFCIGKLYCNSTSMLKYITQTLNPIEIQWSNNLYRLYDSLTYERPINSNSLYFRRSN